MHSTEQLATALAGRYRIERELGRGGMAVVYLAEDMRHRRHVAVKVLHPDLARSIGAERFLREIQIAAGLSHPHILPVHDSGDASDDVLYYVMPYVEGESLRARLERERQLPVDEAVRLAREVAEALAYAHARGLVHRDIKPENILLQSGHALVSDFGIARAVGATANERLTDTGIALGTPAYMSPEQAAAERDVDERSDVYSLGCVLYEMLAGEPPYTGPTAQAVLARKMLEPLPRLRVVRPEIAQMVDDVVTRALARTPADRYPTSAEFASALERTPAGPAAGAAPPLVSHGRRIGIHQILGVLGTAAVVVATVVAVRSYSRRTRAVAAPSRLEYSQLTYFPESATSPALSPDGKVLAFIVGESAYIGPGQIWIKQLPNGESVQLTHDSLHKGGVAFSPDGARITYSTWSSAGYDTWVVPVIGGQPRLFLTNAQALTWTGTASRLLFSAGSPHGLELDTSSEGSTARQVVYHAPSPSMAHRSRLSPDGASALVVEMGWQSWLPCRLVHLDGSAPARLVGPVPAQCTDVAWSPDGRWMYFSANSGNGFHLWRQRFPDGAPEQLTSGVTEEEGLAMAPDGKSLVTSVGTRQSTIWIHDANGERQVTSEGYGMLPTFSPDGRKLYYLLRDGGAKSYVSGALWVADVATGERRRLLPGVLMQAYGVSPDGARVVFVAANDSASSPLAVASLDERSAPHRLLPDDAVWHRVLFAANGDIIVARHDTTAAFIYRMRGDGSDVGRIGPGALVEGVSADARWVAAWDLGLVDRIVVSPVGGGASTVICTECVPPSFERFPWPPTVTWSPDGRFIYLSLFQASYAVPLRPGQALPPIPAGGLRRDEDIAALAGARRIAPQHIFPGPDPSRWAFTKVTIQRNIYRVPLP